MISDFRILAGMYLPAQFQRPRWLAYVACLAAPFNVMRDTALTYRADISRRTGMNGQVCRLKAFLNSALNCTNVEITEGVANGLYLQHRDDASASEQIGHQVDSSFYVGHRHDSNGADFIVLVPRTWLSTKDNSLQTFTDIQMARVNAILNRYKLMQKTYIIKTK